MRNLYRTPLLILLALLLAMQLAAQNHRWEPLAGPYGAPADAIVHTAAGTLLVATSTGLFRSDNSGMTWSRSDSGLYDRIKDLVAHPDGNIIGRLMRGQIVYSTDDGRSWQTAVLDLARYHILTLAGSPDGTLYAGGMNGLIGYPSGVIRSTDAGVTWDTIGLNSANVSAIVADTGGVIVVGLDGYGDVGFTEVQRSTDAGMTWTKVADQQELYRGGSIAALAIDSTGTYWLAQSSALRRSTDRGVTWDSVASDFIYPERGVLEFAVAPNGRLVVGTTTGPYHSTDNGLTWNAATAWPAGAAVRDFAFDAATIFAASDVGVTISADGGTTWQERNNGIPSDVQTLDAGGLQTVMATTGMSIPYSTDNGATWQRRSVSQYPASAVAVSPAGDLFIGYNFFGPSHGTIHRSTDNGVSWTTSTPANAVYTLGFNAAGHLFAAMEHKLIHRSTDNGATWTAANIESNSYQITDFAFDSTRTGYAATTTGVLRTTDNGLNWHPTSLTDVVNDVAVDRAGMAYAAANSGVHRSTDNGNTWTMMSDSAFTSLVVSGNGLLVATPSELGAYRSTDDGATWSATSDGLPDIVTSLARDRSGRVYAGTERNGIYRLMEGSLSVPRDRAVEGGVAITTDDGGATISITSAMRTHTTITLYNSLGERVALLYANDLAAGTHRFPWRADDAPSGTYFISVCRDGECVTRGVTVAR